MNCYFVYVVCVRVRVRVCMYIHTYSNHDMHVDLCNVANYCLNLRL